LKILVSVVRFRPRAPLKPNKSKTLILIGLAIVEARFAVGIIWVAFYWL